MPGPTMGGLIEHRLLNSLRMNPMFGTWVVRPSEMARTGVVPKSDIVGFLNTQVPRKDRDSDEARTENGFPLTLGDQ